MVFSKVFTSFVVLGALVSAHNHHSSDPFNADQIHFSQDLINARQQPFTGPTWSEKYGAQVDSTFSGPLSFSHMPYSRCLDNVETDFDIAILGLPFDTTTSYRPGYFGKPFSPWLQLFDVVFIRARFGPYAIRSGSRRQRDARGYTLSWAYDPFAEGQKLIDCGDVSTMINI